jgi:DNA-binding winged helix-turn-helix (wHTH) protein
VPRYHFDEFDLSPRQRVLRRKGSEQPLIPRYFDLLVFLVERRHEAVHRRDIFDRVWTDVTVSDSALSQAIRTIRRALGDDPREPRFIATVSRHGYRFVFADVREEEEEEGAPRAGESAAETVRGIPETREVSAQPMWAGASAGAALAGATAGLLGGLLLASIPGSAASVAVAPALGLIGACCGALGGAGVGAGLSAADAVPRSNRTLALLLGGAAGGGAVGTAAQWLARWSLMALVGVRLDVGGSLEGLIIGAAAGLGYALATMRPAGRVRIVIVTATASGLAALLLTSLGRPLVGGTIHEIATGSAGSQAALTPLGRLIGEPDFGPVSSAILGTAEGTLFGLGLALGVSRRHFA